MTYARVYMFTNISDSYKNNMMKRTVSYYIIALVFLGLFSCKSERLAPVIEAQERNDISDNTHVLDIAKYTIDTLSLDKLIYDVKYIELENQPEALELKVDYNDFVSSLSGICPVKLSGDTKGLISYEVEPVAVQCVLEDR